MNSAPGRGFFTGLTLMVFAIILIGGSVGVVLSNLPQQMAKADRLRAETEWEARLHEQTNLQNLQAQYEIERQRNQEIAEAARAQQAEQLRLAHLRHNQKLRVEAMLDNVGISLLVMLGFSMVVVLTVTLSRVGWQLAGHVQASAATRPAQTGLLRREEACLQEQKIRHARPAAAPQGMNGNGGYR